MKDLSIRPSPGKGRGVFAERDFAEGEVIERCPVLVLEGRYRPVFGRTVIGAYHFTWVQESEVVALPLGYGCIYNHSWTPNADWVNLIRDNMMDFVAIRDISAGEEVCTHYKYADDARPRWYEEASDQQPLSSDP